MLINGIKELRKLRGMTARELAEKAGVTQRAVFKWERDGTENMRLACAVRVADALGVEVRDLYEGGGS